MTVRSVLEVEVDPNGAFAKFAAGYKQWQEAAANSPSLFAKATAEIDGQVKSFRELVDLAKQRTIHARAGAEVERAAHEDLFGEEDRARAKLEKADKEKAARDKRASEQAKEQAKSWSVMAKDVKSFASGIGTATASLLQWGSLTGLIGGIIGAGGLFGIDRMAASVGNQRRMGLGLGTSPGEQQAFGVNFGRVLQSPDALLSGVNEALHDPRKSIPFGALGLNYGAEQKKGTFGAALDVMQGMKRLADKTPEGMMGPMFDAYHLGDLGSTLQDFLAAKHTPGDEFKGYSSQARADVIGLNLSKDQQQNWQDLQTQLTRASKQIERTFIVGLTPLAKPLDRLSGSFVKAIDAFAHSDRIQKFIGQIGDGLDTFAKDIDSPKFLKSVSDFGDQIGTFAKEIKSELPDIKTLFSTLAGAGRILGNIWSPSFLRAKKSDTDTHQGAKEWNRENPDDQVPVPPKKAEDPDAIYDPASYRTYGSPFGAPRQWGGGWGGSRGGSTFTGTPTPASFIVPKGLGGGGNERMAHAFFRSQGWTEAQTAGLLANIHAESAFNPNAFNPKDPNGGGQGIAQWNGSRAAEFGKLFGHSVRQGTLLEQLMFMQYELTHGEKAAGDALKAHGTSASESADIINRRYERSADNTGGRQRTADFYAHLYSKPQPSVTIHNATGGNAVVTASQLASA
jgi:hypothetical protein